MATRFRAAEIALKDGDNVVSRAAGHGNAPYVFAGVQTLRRNETWLFGHTPSEVGHTLKVRSWRRLWEVI